MSNIEKKPLTMDERKKKMRKDILSIARRYEEMHLYDDAIGFYKKLGKHDDIERLTNIKNDIYIEKAKEFERQEKLEDALRLYEKHKGNTCFQHRGRTREINSEITGRARDCCCCRR
jgi:tetratricopeptide (TPR) repeat protein